MFCVSKIFNFNLYLVKNFPKAIEFKEIQEIKIVGEIIVIDSKKIFNGIIKKDSEQDIANNSKVIKIL